MRSLLASPSKSAPSHLVPHPIHSLILSGGGGGGGGGGGKGWPRAKRISGHLLGTLTNLGVVPSIKV